MSPTPKKKIEEKYDQFIRDGLSIGFTDDQVDFLESYILNTPVKKDTSSKCCGHFLHTNPSVYCPECLPGKIEPFEDREIKNNQGHSGDNPNECPICSLKND